MSPQTLQGTLQESHMSNGIVEGEQTSNAMSQVQPKLTPISSPYQAGAVSDVSTSAPSEDDCQDKCITSRPSDVPSPETIRPFLDGVDADWVMTGISDEVAPGTVDPKPTNDVHSNIMTSSPEPSTDIVRPLSHPPEQRGRRSRSISDVEQEEQRDSEDAPVGDEHDTSRPVSGFCSSSPVNDAPLDVGTDEEDSFPDLPRSPSHDPSHHSGTCSRSSTPSDVVQDRPGESQDASAGDKHDTYRSISHSSSPVNEDPVD